MNTQEIRAYGAAVKQAGGSEGWMSGFISTRARQYAGVGLKFDAAGYFKAIQQAVNAAQSREQKIGLLDAFGIDDEGARLLFLEGRFMDAAHAAGAFAKNTDAGDKAARDFGQSTDKLSQSMTSFWSAVGEKVLPTLSEMNNDLAEFLSKTSESPEKSTALLSGMVLTTTLLASKLKTVLGLLTRISFLGSVGMIGVAASGVYESSKGGSERETSYLGRWINRQLGRGDKSGILPGRPGYDSGIKTGDTGGDAMSFWMSQGYSREQAAGIVANEIAESGGKPGARGDGGKAHGLYQWHPDRRRRILEATGIDVSTASAMDQRRAAAWEMKNEPIFNDQTFRSISSPDEAAAYFSMKFERPADVAGEAFRRGQSALDIAANTPLSTMGEGGSNVSRNTNVKVDKVEVNTQATDAQGIAQDVGSELERILGFAFGNLDDGEAG